MLARCCTSSLQRLAACFCFLALARTPGSMLGMRGATGTLTAGSGLARRTCLLGTVAACVLAGLSGCGPSLPKTYPVKGRVVREGGKPFSGGTITFQMLTDETQVADGEIQNDGTFRLTTKMHGLDKPGAPEGEYNVMVEDPALNVAPDGQMQIKPILVPRKYKVEPKENDLTIEVKVLGR
jgi:hypothetical protein